MIKKILRALLTLIALLVALSLLLFVYNTRFIESKDPVLSAPATTKFIDIGGEKIAYSERDNNSSTTVIFIGGLSAWNGTWERVIQKLDTKRSDLNYIALDLPPFGYSIPDPNKQYFRNVQAERLASFIKNKNIGNVILVGHSYGAGPSTEYVLQNPGLVRKLILIDAVLNIDETKVISKYSPVQFGPLRTMLIGVLIHNDSFAISRLKTFVFISDHVDQELLDVYTRYFDTKNVTGRFSAWFSGYVNDPLNYKSNSSVNYKELAVPVRLIWGDKDTITPIEGTNILIKTVPYVTLKTLNGVGHIPMIENEELFDAALLDAVSK